MRRKILLSAKGLTLVELLLTLSLVGVVSVLIVGVLVSGMNSYKSVNKQISLHDETNAIMTKFSREIFVATKVIAEKQKAPLKVIEIEQYEGENIKFEFKDWNAYINNIQINSTLVKVDHAASSFLVDEENGIVHIHLEITDGNNRSFQLTEAVTYVNVE